MKICLDALKKINKNILRILANLLFQRIPEYKKKYELENNAIDFTDGVYLFMNEFASFLCNEIEKDPTSDVVDKSFIFINEVGESHNLEIINVVKIGILEVLYTSKGIDRKLVSDFLNPRLKIYFQEFSKHYH